VASGLVEFLCVLVAATAAAEVADRLAIPSVLMEIAAGLALGPSLLHLVGRGIQLASIKELGLLLLLFQVGMNTDLASLKSVGPSALRVASLGVVAPFAGGYFVASALGQKQAACVFIGAALTATSVGISARVFSDAGLVASVEAKTVLGASIVDDVFGLAILSSITGVKSGGSFNLFSGFRALAVGASFVVGSLLIGVRLAGSVWRRFERHLRAVGGLTGIAVCLMLGVSLLASKASVAPLIGAFVAGSVLKQAGASSSTDGELSTLARVFVPVFFVGVGVEMDIGGLLDRKSLLLSFGLCLVAIAGKLLAGVARAQSGDRLLIGLGMVPRGEVGLIFAAIGQRTDVLDKSGYASIVFVVLVTTIVTPPLIALRIRHTKPSGGIQVLNEMANRQVPSLVDERRGQLRSSSPTRTRWKVDALPDVWLDRFTDEQLIKWLALADGLPVAPTPRVLVEIGRSGVVVTVAVRSGRWTLASLGRAFEMLSLSLVTGQVVRWSDKTMLFVGSMVHDAVAIIEADVFAERLAIAIQLATHEEHPSDPLVDIEVGFDECGPRRSRMTLVATDRVGLLKRVGGGLGAANVRLIQAEFSTKDGMVSDTFVVATSRRKRLREAKHFELRALLSYVH
jgi:Kef-type K+ transport system membrane component KefB